MEHVRRDFEPGMAISTTTPEANAAFRKSVERYLASEWVKAIEEPILEERKK